MRLALYPNQNWEQLQEVFLKEFHTLCQWSQSSVGTSFYFSTSKTLASFETVLGLAHQFSHKRQVAMIKGFSHLPEQFSGYFLKEGFLVQSLDMGTDPNPLDLPLSQLKKDTNFVFWIEDHPVTGERRAWTQALKKRLSEQKVFSVTLTHFSELSRCLEPNPFEIQIYSVAPTSAFVVRGSRAKSLPTLLSPGALEATDPDSLIAAQAGSFRWPLFDSIDSEEDRKKLVKDFEIRIQSHSGTSFKPFFSQESDRVWDRSVLVSDRIHGELFAQTLSARLGEKLAPFGQKSLVETPNLCRWGGITLYRNWWEISSERIAGMVVISAEALARPHFFETFHKVEDEVLRQSRFES